VDTVLVTRLPTEPADTVDPAEDVDEDAEAVVRERT
jgi:hypothetical protein